MEGKRYNTGKTKWGLLSWPAVNQLVAVLEFGAKKYDSWNWSKGLSWSECFESLQRHAIAWYQGEDKDPETGLSHMAHVMCNAMFLTHFVLFGSGRDDRPMALQQEKGDPKFDNSKFTAEGPDPMVERGVHRVQAYVRPEDGCDRSYFQDGGVGKYSEPGYRSNGYTAERRVLGGREGQTTPLYDAAEGNCCGPLPVADGHGHGFSTGFVKLAELRVHNDFGTGSPFYVGNGRSDAGERGRS